MVIRDVQNCRSPPRGSLRLRRCDDVPMRQVKEEPEDVKPPVLPPGYEVPPSLQDEARDGEFLDTTWAMVASAVELEKDSPGLMDTIERSAQMAASASGSRGGSDGASTSRAHQDGASTSRAGSSSTLILLLNNNDDDSGDNIDWSAASD